MNATFKNAVIDPANRKNMSMKQSFTAIGWCGNSAVIGTASGALVKSRLQSD
jgi:hypothetical protein